MDVRINQGYVITDSCHVGDSEFVLGVHSTAPQQFVTWKCKDQTDYYWGHYIVNYAKTRAVYMAYRKAGYSKKFRAEHEAEILLHQAAKSAFDKMNVKKLPKIQELQTEYAQLLEEKKKTYAEYRRSREEMRELLTAKANVDRLLNMEAEHDAEKEKDHGQR